MTNNVRYWASEIDDATIRQAEKTARLPIVAGHVALMPDAHVGIGSTVGSVIPTKGAIIPAAIGVDIGCGMIASKTNLTSQSLPDDLNGLLGLIARDIPAGVGQAHSEASRNAGVWFDKNKPRTDLTSDQAKKTLVQFGTLGSGNHFVEVCLDENDDVWVVLHSGSRGIGNELANTHIKTAERIIRETGVHVEDPALSFLVEGTHEFLHYITDMLWAQDYALASRDQMMSEALRDLFKFVGGGREVDRINCHHNFTQYEEHNGQHVWLTRKGAIKADKGDRGVIPGSMGTRSYIVDGLGNTDAYMSCSHGAGRRMSRGEARRNLDVDGLTKAMAGKTWNADHADSLIDEDPRAYKDIDQVMKDQEDLVRVTHTLRQILNYKGVESGRRKRR